MVRQIVKDPVFLAKRSENASAADLPVAADLLDTLEANKYGCVGLAANMIGINKRIIAFLDGMKYSIMLNPEIVKKSEPYEAEEGCLSLKGTRTTKRWEHITVRFETGDGKRQTKDYKGYSAQIIQHEIDHCNGILI